MLRIRPRQAWPLKKWERERESIIRINVLESMIQFFMNSICLIGWQEANIPVPRRCSVLRIKEIGGISHGVYFAGIDAIRRIENAVTRNTITSCDHLFPSGSLYFLTRLSCLFFLFWQFHPFVFDRYRFNYSSCCCSLWNARKCSTNFR